MMSNTEEEDGAGQEAEEDEEVTAPPVEPPRPAAGITNAQAIKVLNADIANMVKKVASGQTLSMAQRKMLQGIKAGEPTSTEAVWAKNQVALAAAMDVDRKTIQRWMKIDGNPGARSDGRYNVTEWKRWKNGSTGDGDTPDQTAARAEQILLQNERLRFRIGEEKRKLIPKLLSQRIFGKLLTDAKSRCFTSITRMVTLARTAKDSAEATEEIRKEMIEIWKALEESKWVK